MTRKPSTQIPDSTGSDVAQLHTPKTPSVLQACAYMSSSLSRYVCVLVLLIVNEGVAFKVTSVTSDPSFLQSNETSAAEVEAFPLSPVFCVGRGGGVGPCLYMHTCTCTYTYYMCIIHIHIYIATAVTMMVFDVHKGFPDVRSRVCVGSRDPQDSAAGGAATSLMKVSTANTRMQTRSRGGGGGGGGGGRGSSSSQI